MKRLLVVVGVCAVTGTIVGTALWASAGRRASTPLGGFGSLRAAAASVARGCAKTVVNQGGFGLGEPFVWRNGPRGPVLYWSTGHAIRSSRGLSVPLRPPSRFRYEVGFWPCRTPVAFFGSGNKLWMQSGGKTVSLRPAPEGSFDSHGRLVPPRHPSRPPGIPDGFSWFYGPPPTEATAPPPTHFFVDAEEPGCPSDHDGHLYAVSPSGTRLLDRYSACSFDPSAQWSPDGSHITWDTELGALVVSDSSGRHRRKLFVAPGLIGRAAWSPDGKSIAFAYSDPRVSQVAVVTVATGAVHVFTHIRWEPPVAPSYTPPGAYVMGWSPDSANVLIRRARAGEKNFGSTIEGLPVSGGRPIVFNPPRR